MKFILSALLIFLPSLAFAACPDDFDGPRREIQSSDTKERVNLYGLANGTLADGAGASRVFGQPDQLAIDIRMNSGAAGCLNGVAMQGTDSLNRTWKQAKENNPAMIGGRGDITYHQIRGFNGGDFLRPNRGDDESEWIISGVWGTFTRDDCVENDHARRGQIHDSLFDGCYRFISTSSGQTAPPDRRVAIEDTVIGLLEEPGTRNATGTQGHGGAIKYDVSDGKPAGPLIRYKNVVIGYEGCVKVDGKCSTDSKWFRLWEDPEACENVTVVWGGPGSYPGNINPTWDGGASGCVTVTTDWSVYERARDDWIAAHPHMNKLPDDPFTVITQDNRAQIVQLDVGEPTPPPEPLPDPDVMVTDITQNSAVIQFSFGEETSGYTHYGASEDDLRVKGSETLYDAHRMPLKNLEPGTAYYYFVEGCNAARSCGESEIDTFQTLADETEPPPEPPTEPPTAPSACIEWPVIDSEGAPRKVTLCLQD